MTMSELATPRLAMPLLAAGQAGKELAHNEALFRLDMLVQPAVVGVGTDVPPLAPTVGQCWIVGSSPSGAWAGQAGAIACWTAGGWRFAMPVEGYAVWCISSVKPVSYHGGLWHEGDVFGSRVVIDGTPVLRARGAPMPRRAPAPPWMRWHARPSRRSSPKCGGMD